MKIVVIVLVSSLLAAARSAIAGEPVSPQWDARVNAVAGDVTLFAADAGKKGVPATKGMPLVEDDRLVVGNASYAELAFDGKSIVHLGPNSEFVLRDLDRSRTRLDLESGTFLAKFKKLLEGQSLQVRAKDAVAAVRGTEFGLDVSRGAEGAAVAVFSEGKLEVKGSAGAAMLSPNQETTVGPDGRPTRPSALKRLARYGRLVHNFKRRLVKVAAAWKDMGPEERKNARAAILAKAGAMPGQELKAEPGEKSKAEKKAQSEKASSKSERKTERDERHQR